MTIYTDQPLFDLAQNGEVILEQPMPETVDGNSLASAMDGDPDELEMPGGLRDVDSPLPDNWEGPGVGPDELDDVVREAEFFLDVDHNVATEPPQEGAAPATLPANDRVSVPVQSTVLWNHALGHAERVPPSLIAARAAEIQAMGQLRACRGRRLPDGHVQIVAGMLDWLAVRHIAAEGGEPWTVAVDVEEMTDERAFQVSYAEAAEGAPVAPIDRARWAKQAVVTFGSQRKLADALGIDEANVTRLLQVEKAVSVIRHAITDEWTVSRNQAARFVQLLGGEQRAEVKAFVKTLPPATAAKTFRAIFARFDHKPAAREGDVEVIGDDGNPLGRIRRADAGAVVITLVSAAGAVELPTLIGFVEAALGRLRANAV